VYLISKFFTKITQVMNCFLFIASASIKACRVMGHHIVALEKDRDIFEAILVPIKKTNLLVVTVAVTEPP